MIFIEENSKLIKISMHSELKEIIEKAWDNKELLEKKATRVAIEEVINLLDKGQIRVSEPTDQGWILNEWIKKAVIMYFPIRESKVIKVGPFEFNDKIDLKTGYDALGNSLRYNSYAQCIIACL